MLKINKTKLFAYYRLTRIRVIMDFYPFLIIFGILSTRTYINVLSIITSISILLLLLGSFVINDVEDAEDDAKDPKKVKRNPISAGVLTKQQGYIFYFSLNLIALIPLLLINLNIFLAGLATAVVGYLYSCLPIRFKSRPIVDVLSHGFFLAGAEVLIFALLPNSIFDTKALLVFTGLYLFSMGGDLYNEVRDWVVDREVGLKNTASILGYNLARYVCYTFYGLGIILIALGTASILFRI